MDNTNRSPRRFDGVVMTDQRGRDEAVMLLRLAPAQDERFSFEFYGCLIVAVLHMFKGPAGLLFDIASTPVISDAAGKPLALLGDGRLSDSMRSALERIRSHLRSRSTAQPQAGVPPAIVDQLRFFVFDKGDALVGPEWRIGYAGKTYPLDQTDRGA
jgi:hypothetical protein